MKGFE